MADMFILSEEQMGGVEFFAHLQPASVASMTGTSSAESLSSFLAACAAASYPGQPIEG